VNDKIESERDEQVIIPPWDHTCLTHLQSSAALECSRHYHNSWSYQQDTHSHASTGSATSYPYSTEAQNSAGW